ncbi:DUF1186 domain-containing protein [Methylobacter sp. S3L5C]|uniref:DUF1186 domain-containing protein n=1 Tax=Methylobacter sp. S3L5C TaxID=2839024 RepID=UPI001FACAFFF|nr:DUF1186 domain-containing protein [Methylobacter sp. S3L5C]UOA10392.1 DUF1186 domain-containing protein [Methylobacter sp. S3L5C]
MLTIEQIIAKLNTDNDSIFPREALEDAILQQSAITPSLLSIIDEIAGNPQFVEDTPAFMYALYLLAQFREKRAYPIIVQYFGQLGHEDEALYPTGDMVTEDLNSILASVCNSDLGLIKQLIEDQDVNEYVRSAALGSLVILYNNDQISRGDLVSYIETLLDHCLEQKEDAFFVASVVCNSCDIHPEELYDQLVTCFDQELVDEDIINKEYLDRYLEIDKDKALTRLKENRQCRLINDVITEMEWWACFHPDANLKQDLAPGFEYANQSKVGRNDPCPCGSGKKYKKCCLY